MIVIRRDTPKGLAFNGNVTDVTLPDGTPGLMATWAFIDTNKGESKFSMQGWIDLRRKGSAATGSQVFQNDRR